MSRVANTYWVDERIRAQRVSPRANTTTMQELTVELVGSRAEVRRRGGIVPSWVLFGMVLLAISAVCVTVNMRTRAKAQVAAGQLSSIESEVQTLRSLNQTLKSQVDKLKTDSRTIEIAARSKLNMVRSNEYVVPEN